VTLWTCLSVGLAGFARQNTTQHDTTHEIRRDVGREDKTRQDETIVACPQHSHSPPKDPHYTIPSLICHTVTARYISLSLLAKPPPPFYPAKAPQSHTHIPPSHHPPYLSFPWGSHPQQTTPLRRYAAADDANAPYAAASCAEAGGRVGQSAGDNHHHQCLRGEGKERDLRLRCDARLGRSGGTAYAAAGPTRPVCRRKPP
jgi:hypothetical protein